jgi:hypothetical protein
MGTSISWLAVKSKPPAEVRERLSLIATGRFEETPASGVAATSLPSGWFLMVLDGCDHDFLREATLKRVSAGCEVVAASVEEHVMASRAEAWRDGRRTWSLSHDSGQGIEHLEEAGSLPEAYAAIKARALQEQKRKGAAGEVDFIFDVPLSLAKSFTGFKHDEDGPSKFEILERAAKTGAGGLWGRLFGKR